MLGTGLRSVYTNQWIIIHTFSARQHDGKEFNTDRTNFVCIVSRYCKGLPKCCYIFIKYTKLLLLLDNGIQALEVGGELKPTSSLNFSFKKYKKIRGYFFLVRAISLNLVVVPFPPRSLTNRQILKKSDKYPVSFI